MQEQNKNNLIFLGKIALVALTAFFTIVLLTYAKDGLWSAPLPVLAIVYGIFCFVKKYLAEKKDREE